MKFIKFKEAYMKLLSSFLYSRTRKIDEMTKEIASLKTRVQELMLCGAPSELDRTCYPYPLPEVRNLWVWLSSFANSKDISILEIGSREVVSRSSCKLHFPLAKYTGFDYHGGPNVDVVGDAHRLTDYFEANGFDIVVSMAVFEHLAMPWVVTEEIAKVLRVGGVACIYTHFSWSEHEMPWHFFQFNSTGLEALFNKTLGFETIEAGKGLPMVGRFAYDCDENHVGKVIGALYCSSYIITRKVKDIFHDDKTANFLWRDALQQFYGSSQYPPDTSRFD
jgi:SAM-dependent methyltransferase